MKREIIILFVARNLSLSLSGGGVKNKAFNSIRPVRVSERKDNAKPVGE
jgi:hypothetical protein